MKTVNATITMCNYGTYSFAHCATTKTGKLKSVFIAGDVKGKRLLAKAIAAHNRHEETIADINGDIYSFAVKNYTACALSDL